MRALPSRASDEAEFEQRAYHVALEGVSRWALTQAVKSVLQNKLGHPFFPSPPELRGLCDAAIEPLNRMRERIARQERLKRQTPPSLPPISPEVRARQEERMRRFHRAMSEPVTQDEIEEIAAKYGPEVLANIPDAPDAVPHFSVPKYVPKVN